MIRFRVEHHTVYSYAASVGLNFGEARLLPREAPGQQVLAARLTIEPAAEEYRERIDAFGNRVAWFSLRQPHTRVVVSAHCEIARAAPIRPSDSPSWESVVDTLATPGGAEADLRAREFCLESPRIQLDETITDYVRVSFSPGRPLLDAVADLTARVRAEFAYLPQATEIDTPLREVLQARHGVCQDFAHLCIAGLRGLGLAARYVSGWLETTPAPGTPPQRGADASHAWIAVYLPDLGWFDFDPTNGTATGAGHLSIAWGRDYDDVVPLKGVIFGVGTHSLEVGVTVERQAPSEDGA